VACSTLFRDDFRSTGAGDIHSLMQGIARTHTQETGDMPDLSNTTVQIFATLSPGHRQINRELHAHQAMTPDWLLYVTPGWIKLCSKIQLNVIQFALKLAILRCYA